MTSTKPTLREALAEASDFARDVWRDCWAVMLIIVAGRTLVFLGHHVSAVEWTPGVWPTVGEVLTLAYIPLFGALYRLGVGGPALDSLGWGGLQWTGVEWRLLGVWIVLGFALGIVATPLAMVSFPLLYLFKHHAAVSLGPLGSWSAASIFLAPFWLGFAAFILFTWGRLGLAGALTTARQRVSPFASWALTRGLGWTIGLAWLIVQLPMVFGWVGLWAMGLAEAGDIASGPAETWPLLDAAIAGVVVALLAAAIQVPLSVGLLSGLYRWLAQEAGEATLTEEGVISTLPSQDEIPDAPVPPEPEPEPEREPEGPPRALSPWPHTVLPRRRPPPDPLTPIEPDPAPLPAEADAHSAPAPEDHPALHAAPEAAPTVEPEAVEHRAHEPSPPEPDVRHPPAPEPFAHVGEAALARPVEPDQIIRPERKGDEPEPHA